MAWRLKRRRENTSAAPETPVVWTLPADLLLEIVERTDARALVCCAAACKLLRRDILSPSFIRRASHQAAPHILTYLSITDDDKPFTLAYPATPAATFFCHGHLFPFFLRHAAGLFDQYTVETSRQGLVLLCRVNDCRRASIKTRYISDYCADLCVCDPMNSAHTFLSRPPRETESNPDHSNREYVMLNDADGIYGSFMLLAVDFYRSRIKVHTASPCGTWGPLTHMISHDFPWGSIEMNRDPSILHGGVIHWLVYHDMQILSYDLDTGKTGSVKLPHTNCDVNQLHLATSLDGKLLKLLAIEEFILSVWLQILVSPGGDSGWSMETVIDMEEKVRSLHPNIPSSGLNGLIVFDESQKRGCDVVLLEVPEPAGCYNTVTVFDLETKDMHTQKCGSTLLLEIDLPSRLRDMKIFS